MPDVTVAIAPSVTRGLSRKRPRHNLNVTAFEKRLKGGDGEFRHCFSVKFLIVLHFVVVVNFLIYTYRCWRGM